MTTIFKRIIRYMIMVLMSSINMIAQNRHLADLYKTGNIRLIEEYRIDDKKLEKNILFENPRGIAVDNRKNVYITDFSANHIKIFDEKGKFIRIIGQKGQGPGDFSGPGEITINKDRIAVQETFNQRISILNMNGEYEKSVFFDPDARYGFFKGMKTMPDGRLIISRELGLPKGFSGLLPVDQDDVIEVLSDDLQNKKIIYEKKYRASRWYRNPETKSMSRVYFPYYPQVCFDVSMSGIIAIGYSEKYEIEYFDMEHGSIRKIARPYDPIKLEERDKEEHFNKFVMAVIENNFKKILPKPPEYIIKLTEFPENLPPYRDIIFDSENNLWVQLYTRNRTTNIFDIYSPNGEFINQVIVEGAPIDGSITTKINNCFYENGLWRIEKDKDGFVSIVKYIIKKG